MKPRPFARTVALHSLGWLVAANLVGLWMAVSLIWPAVGDLLAPLTFGRWTPLHMNWQLYGWCALPVAGALLAWCLDDTHPRIRLHAALVLGAWSLALALGGAAWLAGDVSGKLFLDWHGWSRPLLPLAQLGLWGVLVQHTWRRWATLSRGGRMGRVALLSALLAVPGVIHFATSRAVYHPINPDSGGATGAAILGSVIGIMGIFMLLPRLLGVPMRTASRGLGWTLAVSFLVFVVVEHGNSSHHSPAQIAALGVLLVWLPLLPLYWSRQVWPVNAIPWLRAASVWWGLLIINGWVSFLPQVSEAFKFTHALVGHAHLAMAAMLTCVNAAILATLTGRDAGRFVFWAWQAGCAVYIIAMLGLGVGEVGAAAELFRSEAWTQAWLGARLVAGLGLTAASIRWFARLAMKAKPDVATNSVAASAQRAAVA